MDQTESAKYNEIIKSLEGKYSKVLLAADAYVKNGYVFHTASAARGIGYTNEVVQIGHSLGGSDKPDIINEHLMVIKYPKSGHSIAFVGDLESIKKLAIPAAEQHNKQI